VAYRAMEAGVSVQPEMKMRVAENTLDLGKLPQGTGFSPLANNGYSVPFAPTGSRLYFLCSWLVQFL
jgi:hypothetical protein